MGPNDVQHVTVPLAEAAVGPVELEPCLCIAARIEPQAEHVLHSERACDLLKELERVVVACGEDVRIFPRADAGRQRVLVFEPPVSGRDLGGYGVARAAGPGARTPGPRVRAPVGGETVA